MKGIGVSPGIAIGKVLIKKESNIKVIKKDVHNIQDELDKLAEAKKIAKEQIEGTYQHTFQNIGEKEAEIFQAHLMILDDPDFFGQVVDLIKENQVNVEWALKETTEYFLNVFDNIEDEYLKERSADLKDVSDRILRILLGSESTDLMNLDEDVVIIANDLTPSDTAQMNKNRVLGFVTEIGGKTAHTAIMARTLEIPAIVGVEGITDVLKNGDLISIDGSSGTLIINPDKKTIDEHLSKKKDYEDFRNSLKILIGAKSVSKDGKVVELAANIGTPADVDNVIKNDGEGIGLYRTEFLYMDRDDLPTEEEQFVAYKDVAERLSGKPVIIRTLDVGGDKYLPYLELPEEMNPFLGYRAIRICLDKTDIFKTQLRAILRASAFGNIKVMFPMISSIEELREAKKIIQEVKEELIGKDICFNENIEVGIMIEVPAAAIMSDLFAKEVDFFSIGTNDLIQYTIAVDRGNRKISYLYNQFHPALLRLIKLVIDNGHKEGIWVGMCGEAAGDPDLIPILLGMGLDEFSMSSISILRARWIIKNTSQSEIASKIDEILMLPTAKDVKEYITENISRY